MKLLAVCQHYYPENFQITPICEQLAKDGYDVTVLTGLPNYPSGVVPPEYKTGHRDEMINGVRVIRCYEFGRRKGPVFLAVNYLSYMSSALMKSFKLDADFDLVFIYQLSPVLMAIPGQRYAKRRRVPVALYCCDLWPESMKMYIKSESNPLFRLMKAVSKRIYDATDRIMVQSHSFLSYLREVHGIPMEKMSYLPAFADEAYLRQDFTPEGDTTDFVFLGNLGIAQNLIAVLKAVEKIKDLPGFQVHFVGSGSMLSAMQEFVAAHGLGDIVRFYGQRPVEEMPDFYRLADACLVSLKADNATGLTLPAKVQGYMAAGKPILGMMDGSAKQVIEESGCGVCVGAGDIDGFADAMRSFVTEKEKYAECGRKAREYFIENFRKDRFIKRLEETFEELARH